MSDYKPIPVATAKRIALVFEKDVVVVLGVDNAHERCVAVTFATAPAEKQRAAEMGEACAKALGWTHEETTEDFRDPAKMPGGGNPLEWMIQNVRALQERAVAFGFHITAEDLEDCARDLERGRA